MTAINIYAPDGLVQEVEDVIEVMRGNESGNYHCIDYFTLRPILRKEGVDEAWRQRMCEWMYGVVDHCNFKRDIVAVAAAYLDLCLTIDSEIIHSKRTYQLAAMTALYLAMKIYDTTFVKLESLIKLGRGLFDANDVLETETQILKKLRWRVHPPTPMCFLRHYARLIPSTVPPSTSFMITEVSRFVAEISVCLYKFVKFSPSMIAYASLCIAMEGIDEASLPMWQRQQIYLRLSTSAKISYYSPEPQELITKLRHSFEKNVDIRSLMTTIDPNCHVRYSSSKQLSTEGAESPKEVAHAMMD